MAAVSSWSFSFPFFTFSFSFFFFFFCFFFFSFFFLLILLLLPLLLLPVFAAFLFSLHAVSSCSVPQIHSHFVFSFILFIVHPFLLFLDVNLVSWFPSSLKEVSFDFSLQLKKRSTKLHYLTFILLSLNCAPITSIALYFCLYPKIG